MEENKENHNEENKVIDTEFIEDNYTKFIRGKPLYYKTAEVADKLTVSDSTIRFWCTQFKNYLPIETSGRNRMFKDGDIEKLKFIKKLLYEDGLSVQQTKEFLQEVSVNGLESKIVEKSEPLPMQVLINSVVSEIGGQLDDIKEYLREQIIQEMKEQQLQQQNSLEAFQCDLKEHIAITVSEGINTKFEEFKTYIDEVELKQKERDLEMIDKLKESMEQQKSKNEEEGKKGFLSRLFGK